MFFITCFERLCVDDYGLHMGDYRTFGFKETFEEAEKDLHNNTLDMFETIYHYAIVEEMHPAIHPHVMNRWFFKWDKEKEGFFRIKEPKEFKHYTNIALG